MKGLRMVAAGLVLMGGAGWGQVEVGDATLPPAGAPVLLAVEGKGVQVYTCKQTDAGPAWVFARPEAKLLNPEGAVVGRHEVGPVWVLKDGGSVRGRTFAQKASPDANSVPWLLLDAMDSVQQGALRGVRWIRRSATHGGKARGDGCDARKIGVEDRVDYTATYTFYGAVAGKN